MAGTVFAPCTCHYWLLVGPGLGGTVQIIKRRVTMKWMKTGVVMLALGSLLCTTVAFTAPNMADNLYRGSKLIGADVENAQGENLGNIKDVVLNSRGHIEYAVLAFGGFMGMGEKY